MAGAATWSGSLQKISATTVELRPGEEKSVTVTFKNTGSSTWKRSGKTFVSLYTVTPKYHASQVRGSDWKSDSETAPIVADVAPGKTGTITFSVKAPTKPGIYNEHFQLAVEDTAWIAGTSFALAVNVAKTSAVAEAAPASGELAATKLMMSSEHPSISGGKNIELTVLFKNSGTAVWGVRKLVQESGIRIATGDNPSYFDPSWASETVALAVSETVLPGRTVFLRFKIAAPAKKGEYSAKFKLVVDDKDVPGGNFDLPVTVTDDAPASSNPQPGPGISPTPVIDPFAAVPAPLAPEPPIRVGVATVPVRDVVLSSTSNLSVRDGNGALLGIVPAGSPASIKLNGAGSMQVVGASNPISVSGIVRFIPDAGGDAATKVSAGSGQSWDSWADGARFRGTIEIRYYAPADVTWVIDELPIEKYMYGLAEMSNGSPHEYQKALVTAARTYAYWHLMHPGKHVTFTVDATFDQVYRGYDREIQQPNIVKAVEETRGQIVHYNGAPVVTPYYANSDGRTRAWTEVWGGAAKPWLVSVVAKYDIGKKMWGHGVGMSARDAAYRADDDGWTWDQLVKYYYTGVELKRLW